MRNKMLQPPTGDSLLDAFISIVEMGYPIATFAKAIERDSSTLYKWVDGSRQISNEVREQIEKRLDEMKDLWNNLKVK